MSTLHVGQRVRILVAQNYEHVAGPGVIHNYLPSRPCPWHVRPDGAFWDNGPGIAFHAWELESLEESEGNHEYPPTTYC
jgi:hypothetical protein